MGSQASNAVAVAQAFVKLVRYVVVHQQVRAVLQHSGQIEFWALIGKAALNNPVLPIDFVRDLMVAKAEGKSPSSPFVRAGPTLMASPTVSVTPLPVLA